MLSHENTKSEMFREKVLVQFDFNADGVGGVG